MVAHACLPGSPAIHARCLVISPLLRAAIPGLESAAEPVKVLDLLTNRYHAGLVRASSESAMELELPVTSHLHAGQRVRFVVGGESPLVSRQAMRGACITQVHHGMGDRLRVELALSSESEAAAA